MKLNNYINKFNKDIMEIKEIGKNPYYFLGNGKIAKINDLLEKEIINCDNKIYEKFLYKYKNNIFTKKFDYGKLDGTFFLYPYSIGYGFPMSNIAKIVQIAKMGDSSIVNNLNDIIYPKIIEFIKKGEYDGVIITPHSTKRYNSPLIKINNNLKEDTKIIFKIINVEQNKITSEIKNIRKFEDKIKVASSKFLINEDISKLKKILIIDDMINTGATINAIANLIKNQNNDIIVHGIGIIGSLDNKIISDI